MFLSGLRRKRPRMLIASTRRPLSARIFMIVRAHSYRIALPTFFADSVLVATYKYAHNVATYIAT
jgi:hypothetical protein